MFERYTEQARRAIFFARYEASNIGSPYIEAEHLLLGTVRAGAFGDGILDAIRSEMQKALPPAPAPSVDLPVGASGRRVITRAAEEAQNLGHQHIGVEHFMLALLAQGDGSFVAQQLRKHHIDPAIVPGKAPAPVPEPVDRESLRALIEQLPDDRLPAVKRMLEHLHNPPPLPPRIAELKEAMKDRFRRGMRPGMMGGGGSGGSWNADPEGRVRDGCYSSSRFEDGVQVVETHHFRDGHEITLVDRFRLSEDGKTLSCTGEVEGPGKSERKTIDFDVSPENGKNAAGSDVT